MKPLIIFEGQYNTKLLNDFKNNHKIWKIKEIIKIQLKELFEINNPHLITSDNFLKLRNKFISERLQDNPELKGNWIYFPWSGILTHTVNEKQYHELLTNRNKNLITVQEQKMLYDKCIAFAGLSVGSHFATGLVHCGIAGKMKLADFDILNTTNLNRMNNSLNQIGESKIQLLAQQIYEINPYEALYLFPEGLNDKVLDQFTTDIPKPDLIFEMIDDFKMKIKLRLEARKAGIPLIMLTHLADNLLIDIERYDLQPELPIFNGLFNELTESILANEITELAKVKYAIEIVGRKNLTERLFGSLQQINKTLTGRPQLYSSVAIGGGFASYMARQIFTGNFNKSGRFYVSFEKFLK